MDHGREDRRKNDRVEPDHGDTSITTSRQLDQLMTTWLAAGVGSDLKGAHGLSNASCGMRQTLLAGGSCPGLSLNEHRTGSADKVRVYRAEAGNLNYLSSTGPRDVPFLEDVLSSF